VAENRHGSIGELIGAGRTAEVFQWGEGHVVKLFRAEFARRAGGELEAAKIAHAAGARTPAAVGVVEIRERPGIVFEYVNGPALMRTLSDKPWRLRRGARELAELHAGIHGCSAPELPRQVESFRSLVEGAEGLSRRQRDAALSAVDRLPERDSLCHGDMHPGNVIEGRDGLVAIDWGTAVRGDPLVDASVTAMIMQLAELPPGTPWVLRTVLPFARDLLRGEYLRSYRAATKTRDELCAWQLPLAAARLGRGISGERAALLRLIEAEVAR
jgi:aminoglycoside phosphotransferase (APT) family kinase protein